MLDTTIYQIKLLDENRIDLLYTHNEFNTFQQKIVNLVILQRNLPTKTRKTAGRQTLPHFSVLGVCGL